MPRKAIGLFVEDSAHDTIIREIVKRVSREHGVDVRIESAGMTGNVLHGHGNVLKEFRQYVGSLKSYGQKKHYDLLIVALDANCHGFNERFKEIREVSDAAAGYLNVEIVCAVPDPHIERWLLLDAEAFKQALGRGCEATTYKCERGRYKKLLRMAVFDALKMWPPLGGLEYSPKIIGAQNFERLRTEHKDFAEFINALYGKFREWMAEQ